MRISGDNYAKIFTFQRSPNKIFHEGVVILMLKKLVIISVLIVIMLAPVKVNAAVPLDAAHFPDPVFRSWMSQWDYGWEEYYLGYPYIVGANDGILSDIEIARIYALNPLGSSLKGIEYLWGLKILVCRYLKLTELDITKNSGLTLLNCEGNKITELDVHSNDKLKTLICSSNDLSELNLKLNKKLERLECNSNDLSELDLYQNTALTELHCRGNKLTSLDLSKNTSLKTLRCDHNCLTELDLEINTNLTTVTCSHQESSGLIVKATSYGYEVNLKDYVSKLENIDVSSIKANKGSATLLSYDGETGIVIFNEFPTELSYMYRTHSPNNDLMDVTIKVSMKIDVIERGGPTENIIYNFNDNNYLGADNSALDERSIFYLSERKYGKKGFVADGNSRLIVRVQTRRPGNVTFELKDNIGVEVERFTNRAKLNSSTPVHTTEIGMKHYQASAVLVAPEMYPKEKEKSFPSDKFTVHVTFTADETGEEIPDSEKEEEEDISLEIHAAPVILLRGFGTLKAFGSAEATFGITSNKGIWRKLKDNKFIVGYMNYDGKTSPTKMLSGKDNPIFNMLVGLFYKHYGAKKIVCTKADVIAFGLGGLMARHFCNPDAVMDDGNYYSFRSYKHGMIRRIITIATPHRGTTWANYLLGDFKALNNQVEPGIVQTLRYAFLGTSILARLISANNADEALKDMAVGGRIPSEAYPVNVPIHSIYGKSKEEWEFWLNILLEIIDFSSIYKTYSLVKQLIPMYKSVDFVYSVQHATMLTKEQIRLIIEEHMRDLHKALLGSTVHQLSNHSVSGSWPGQWINGLFHMIEFALSPWTSSVSLMNQMFQETLAFGDENDFCVTATSAGGDFAGYSTAMTGLGFNHLRIAHADETANRVIELLKGPKSSFRVFTKYGEVSNSHNDYIHKTNLTDKLNLAPDEPYLVNFNMTIEPAKIDFSDKGIVQLTAKAYEKISSDYICMVIRSEGINEIIPVGINEAGNFETKIEFTSRDTGIFEISCFSRGDEGHLYISNTVNLVVNSNITKNEAERINFSGTEDVIFTNISSEIAPELYVNTSNGLTFLLR